MSKLKIVNLLFNKVCNLNDSKLISHIKFKCDKTGAYPSLRKVCVHDQWLSQFPKINSNRSN